jgi:hypothetical protein
MLASDVITPAQALVGDSNGVWATDTICIIFLNDALREIARETLLLEGSISTTGNAVRSGYDLASTLDLILIKRVTYDSVPLAMIEQEAVDRLLVSTTPDNTPSAYYTYSNKVGFFPNPISGDTTAIAITYAKLHSAITATGNTVTVPDTWRTELINFIVARLHERNENWRAAELYAQKFRESLSARKYESQSRDDTFHVVSPDFMDQDYYNWSDGLT